MTHTAYNRSITSPANFASAGRETESVSGVVVRPLSRNSSRGRQQPLSSIEREEYEIQMWEQEMARKRRDDLEIAAGEDPPQSSAHSTAASPVTTSASPAAVVAAAVAAADAETMAIMGGTDAQHADNAVCDVVSHADQNQAKDDDRAYVVSGQVSADLENGEDLEL